jgi:hypothetical protein
MHAPYRRRHALPRSQRQLWFVVRQVLQEVHQPLRQLHRDSHREHVARRAAARRRVRRVRRARHVSGRSATVACKTRQAAHRVAAAARQRRRQQLAHRGTHTQRLAQLRSCAALSRKSYTTFLFS